MSQLEADSLQVITAQWVLPIGKAPIEHGFVAVAQGQIVAVGGLNELPSDWPRLTPELGSILTPGLVNAHVHLEQSFPEAIYKTPDEAFTAWLLRVVQRLQANIDAQAKLERCFAGVREALSAGTTCVNDIISGPESLQALDTLGLRGAASLEVFHPGSEPVSIDHWVAKYESLQQAYAGHARLRVGLSPHSPYNVSPSAWQALLAACNPPLVHAHVAEFEDESAYTQGKPSCVQDLHQAILGRQFAAQSFAESPVAYLLQFGLLNAKTIIAHAIHASASDRQRLAEAGVSVAHCPRSNLALHGQTLRASDWQGLEVPIALGTDGRLSTENLDLRAEARCAMQQQGWTAQEALEAMTIQGAKALGLSSEIGTLTSGKAADMVLWQAPINSSNEPEAQVLLPETKVSSVMIDGEIRWAEGEL